MISVGTSDNWNYACAFETHFIIVFFSSLSPRINFHSRFAKKKKKRFSHDKLRERERKKCIALFKRIEVALKYQK